MSRESRLGIALLGSAGVLGVLGDFLFQGQLLGLNVAVWMLVFVAALTALLRLGRAPLHQGRRWMVAPLLLFAACFAWRDSSLLTAANLVALAGGVTLGALRRTEPRLARAGVLDYVSGLAAASFSAFGGA